MAAMLLLKVVYVESVYDAWIPQTKHTNVYGMETLGTANHPETMVND